MIAGPRPNAAAATPSTGARCDALDVESHRDAFDSDGFAVLRGWLDVERDLEPLQRELGLLIEHAARACGARYDVPADPAEFDCGYLALVNAHPEVQPLVYDMAKNLVSFQRLIVNERLAGLYRALRRTELAGTAPGANGVRIDRPGDDRRLAPWHQEFQYQFRSLDGMTFWMPLVPVTEDMGPVVLARGSHRGGVEPLVDETGAGEAGMASGAYGALRLPDEGTIPERYELTAPESRPGDVFAFDFLTLHASAPNVGARARWTVQIRYFNFSDAYGASIRWMGGLKHGTSLASANSLLAQARSAALRR